MLSPFLVGEGQGERSFKIPVLVELRYYRTSILDLIQDFLQRHDPNLTVDAEMLKSWLRQGQLLLLVDGLRGEKRHSCKLRFPSKRQRKF